MTKQEFLEELREALSEELDSQQVYEQMNYYTNYINEQTGAGRSEAEILEELGDARIIAHTIIDGIEQEQNGYREHARPFADENGNVYERRTTTYTSENGAEIPSWQAKLKLYGCLGLVLVFVFVIVALVTRLFIWLLPSIVVIALLVWIFKQLNGR